VEKNNYQNSPNPSYNDTNLSWQQSIAFQSRRVNRSSVSQFENKNSTVTANKYLSKQKTIFCIDDSPTIQLIVKNILSKVGFHVIGNTEPLQSLTILLRSKKPDLIFMDIKMPGVEGHNILQLIKRSRKLKDIPVIMLTAEKDPFEQVKSRLLGAVGYITKPFSAEELITKVEETLANKIEKNI